MLSIRSLRALRIAGFSVLLLSLSGVLASAQNSPLDKQVSSVLPRRRLFILTCTNILNCHRMRRGPRPSWRIACARLAMKSRST